MEVARKQKTVTIKDVIVDLKNLYDAEGVNGCAAAFKIVTKTAKHPERVLDLFYVLYKIDTCESTCFENLESKNICSCLCNGESMVLWLLANDLIGEA